MNVSKKASRGPARGRSHRRLTQAARRARTRDALLESAARGLSRDGYANLTLERVAREAGYTRGALYHLFTNKEDLALATMAWVTETWDEEVGQPAERASGAVAELVALARGHAVYCRRDVARLLMTLRVELSEHDHPLGGAVQRTLAILVKRAARLITAGRREGEIPPGPPPQTLALAYVGAVEGTIIQLAGKAPDDELIVERVVLGLLGLDPLES